MAENETLENKRKSLIFRPEHRGTKEMDLVMGSFAKKYIAGFTEEELALYDEILNDSDPDLYNWISGIEVAPDYKMNSVFKRLLGHSFA